MKSTEAGGQAFPREKQSICSADVQNATDTGVRRG